ncbi:sodium-independent anion transporter [Streptomyces omiyaensis]|uniref:SulP family inorganic anion transporter n=1 Tax=Streptomyces omiyaensis TaxID=68247 RepID=UPI0019C41CF1|nr:SulP family inorganic anion transporter [Streptomyces omiyaensis]GGY70077.1 sodium-independent anion transporter [Streptomyces omiyaensis]
MSSALAPAPAPVPAPTPAVSRLRPRKPDWWGDPRVWRTEVLAGLVVALALIPEAIAFSVIAGVDPARGLFASFTMAVTTAIVGGRRAMISAATGAVALVIAPVNREHGVEFLVATVILAGVFQMVLGGLGVAKLMRFVPRPVLVGSVNSLAALVFLAQLPETRNVPVAVYGLIAAGIVLLVLFPKVTTLVPAPLVTIAVLTLVTVAAGIAVPTVGDRGALPSALPVPGLPDVPFTLGTLATIAPYALAVALVGLVESLLTAKLVDDLTDTPSGKTRESVGQGVANVVTGLFGGMGGCAVIGQTMMNVKVAGARTRLSTFLAGAFLMALCVVLGPVVSVIPMAALVAVMVIVSVAAFDWESVAPRTLRRTPVGETVVMLVTLGCVLVSHNLALGVVVGSVTACVVFARRMARRTTVTSVTGPDGASVVHRVSGELFFASAETFADRFDHAGDPARVVIDLSAARVSDASAIAALDAVEAAYARHGKTVELTGLTPADAALRTRLRGATATGD